MVCQCSIGKTLLPKNTFSQEWVLPLIGFIVGAYIGGVTSNGGELNPGKWDKDSNTWLGMAFGGAMGAAGGYWIANPAAFTLVSQVYTPYAQFGIGITGVAGSTGMGTDWKYDFRWSTSAGNGGVIDLGKPVTAADIAYGSNRHTNYYTGGYVDTSTEYDPKLAYYQGAYHGTPIPELSAALFLDADFKGYYYGAKVYEHSIFNGGAGICLPPFGIGVEPGVYGSDNYYNKTLLAHEYGHWLQYYNFGPNYYYGVIAPASLYFAVNRTMYGWTEIDANRRSYEFHGNPTWWRHFYFPLIKP